MLRCCLPESSPCSPYLPFCHNRGRSLRQSAPAGLSSACAAMLCSTSPDCARYAGPRAAGFAHTCSGFARIRWWGLSGLARLQQKGGRRSSVLAAMVPRLSLRGQAWPRMSRGKVGQTGPTLEAVLVLFQVRSGEIVETPICSRCRGGSCCLHMSWPLGPMPSPLICRNLCAPHANVQTVPLR